MGRGRVRKGGKVGGDEAGVGCCACGALDVMSGFGPGPGLGEAVETKGRLFVAIFAVVP